MYPLPKATNVIFLNNEFFHRVRLGYVGLYSIRLRYDILGYGRLY